MKPLTLVLTLFLSACVTPHTLMTNDAGQEVTCQAVGGGIIGIQMAMNSHDRCVSDAQMRGFHKKI